MTEEAIAPGAIPEEELERADALYEEGLLVQAYDVLRSYGHPERWQGTRARLLGVSLLWHLGAPTAAHRLMLRAYRADRANHEALCYYLYDVLERRGPLVAWERLQKHADVMPVDPEIRAYWYILHARVQAAFRDFDVAEAWLLRAEEAFPDDPRIAVERATMLLHEDRYDEALEAARRSLALQPGFASGALYVAHLLQLRGREGEALDLLASATAHTERPILVAQQIALHRERGEYEAASACLDRYTELAALADEHTLAWIEGVRANLAYFMGDLDRAGESMRRAGHPYFKHLLAHLAAAPAGAQRVVLPVTFVRQHQLTCAPATLAALSGYWQMPADHLEIADAICYDGTPWHSQRDWAERNGWAVRELTVTWESAVALIDRGVPFTLTTAGPGYAHLQAVVGYDSRRGTLLLRDPYDPAIREPLGREMLESLRPYGPRGMALVPRREEARLANLDLPDTALYDLLYAAEHALAVHRRDEAQAACDSLRAIAPDHAITQHARRALAAYDTDPSGALAAIEALLALFPKEPNLNMARLAYLRQMGRREERLTLLAALCADAGRKPSSRAADDPEPDDKDDDAAMIPLFWQEYAEELSADARQHSRAMALCRRAIRYAPTQAVTLNTLAGLLWRRQEFARAAQLYRFAACVEPHAERYSRAYFSAARWLHQEDRALELLRARYARLGAQSDGPARTLFQALEQLGRLPEAFDLLADAQARRPKDGELRLFAAYANGRYGRFAQANRLLEQAEGETPESHWLRTAAHLAGMQNESQRALGFWQRIVELDPLALDAHEEIARLLAQLQGPQAAIRHFEAVTAAFPHHYELHRARVTWLRHDDDLAARERALRHMLGIDPDSAWTRRELALCLARARRPEEADREARIALELEPNASHGYVTLGFVCGLAGRWPEAQAAYRRALELTVDNDYALGQLVAACDTPQDRCAALRFMGEQLERQTVFGPGLLAYQRRARNVLPPEEAYGLLARCLETRPGLWEAWSAMIDQLRDMDRLVEAVRIAEEATARFPLMPTLWQDLATLRGACGDAVGERAALEQALLVAPGNSGALQQLAHSYGRTGQIERAREVMERAVQWDALDTGNLAGLAYYLWECGQKQEAVERIRQMLRVSPDDAWGWRRLRVWCDELGRGDEATQAVRDLTARRPGEVRSWLLLARTLHAPGDLDERLAACDRAIALNARCEEAYDLKAELLADAGRYDEALAACHPAGGAAQPVLLRMRQARIAAQRGDRSDAIRQLRAMLQEHSGEAQGWLLFCTWLRQEDDHAAYVDAAQQLVRLDPQEETSWGYLGEAHSRMGDRPAAIRAWQRALTIAPGYSYGAVQLLDAQIEDRYFAGAEQTVTAAHPHRREGWPLLLALKLAAAQLDPQRASEALRELCLCPGDLDDELKSAAEVMSKAGMDAQAQAVYEAILHEQDLQPEGAAQWAQVCVRRRQWDSLELLPRLLPRDEVGHRAARAWMNGLLAVKTEAKLRRLLLRFLKRHQSLFAGSDTLWGLGAYTLMELNETRQAVRWTDDWRQREKAQPWMLLNRVAALRHRRHASEAGEVGRHALTLKPDHTTPRHALWLFLDAALAGQTAAAGYWPQVPAIEKGKMTPFYRFLYGVGRGLEAIQSAPQPERRAAFATARGHLAQSRADYRAFNRNALLRTTYARSVWRIATETGTPYAYLWAIGCLLTIGIA